MKKVKKFAKLIVIPSYYHKSSNIHKQRKLQLTNV